MIVVVFLIGKAFKIELVADFRNNGEIVGNTISDFFGCAEILSGAGVVFQRGALILQEVFDNTFPAPGRYIGAVMSSALAAPANITAAVAKRIVL